MSQRQVRVPLARCWQVPRPEQLSGQLYLVMLSVKLQLCASSPLTPTKYRPARPRAHGADSPSAPHSAALQLRPSSGSPDLGVPPPRRAFEQPPRTCAPSAAHGRRAMPCGTVSGARARANRRRAAPVCQALCEASKRTSRSLSRSE